jgi:amidase
MQDLTSLDALAQADLVRRGEVSPLELVETAITRLEQLNPQLNAVITPMYDLARQAAAQVDKSATFAGVPFLVKDILAFYGGVRYSAGSRFLADFVPDHDSTLVAKQKKSGLITIGKTNTPEFGILPTTEPQFNGATRNPWNLAHTPGGSSGGAAAAVAARIVPMAHANDGGGSIRIPAACCGLFGLKPTRARNSLGPDIGEALAGLVVEHAVTLSVRDSAALLDATCGAEPGDPYVAPLPVRPFLEEVGEQPGRLRIAFTTQAINGAEIHPDALAAVAATAKLCEDLGHEVVEATPQLDGDLLNQAFFALWTTGVSTVVEAWSRVTGKEATAEYFEPLTWALREMGLGVSGVDYALALSYLQSASRQVARFFTQYDLLLTPTLAEPPVTLGTFDASADNPLGPMFRAGAFVPFTPIANITGQPAMSVPLYWNAENLPLGSHFIGRFGDEATLFRLAAQLEAAHPWAHRRPPVCA